jgi:hypothetical protein
LEKTCDRFADEGQLQTHYVAQTFCEDTSKNKKVFAREDKRWECQWEKTARSGRKTTYTAYMEWDATCKAETEQQLDGKSLTCMEILNPDRDTCDKTNGNYGE